MELAYTPYSHVHTVLWLTSYTTKLLSFSLLV